MKANINNTNVSNFTQLISEGDLRFHEGNFYLSTNCDQDGNELPEPIVYRLNFELTEIPYEVFSEMEEALY